MDATAPRASNTTLRISCLQSHGIPGDIAYNLAEIDNAAEQAARQGADLLITPEMFVTGYDCGPLPPLFAQGYDFPRCVADIASRHRLAILAGLPLALPGGGIGNSAIFVDYAGTVLAEHTKTHFYGDLDNSRFTAGPQAPTMLTYRGVTIAILICIELEYPELPRMAAVAGAELIAVLTSNMEPYTGINEHLVWTRAWENQTHVAYVNRCGSELATDYPGLSSIYGPHGNLLARGGDEPALLTADIEPAAVIAARRDFHYLAGRRPRLYSALTHATTSGVAPPPPSATLT